MPDTALWFGDYTFSGQRFNHLTIPKGIQLESAGGNPNHILLDSLFIPETLNAFPPITYTGSSSLIIPGSITYFANDSFILDDYVKNIIFMDGIEYIGPIDSIFHPIYIKTIEIPKSVTYISKNAFSSFFELNTIIVRGKTEAPSDFEEGWNNGADVIYRP